MRTVTSGSSLAVSPVGIDIPSFILGRGKGGSGGVTVEALPVNENGVYTAPSGKAYSPVTVAVPYYGLMTCKLAQGAQVFPLGSVLTIDATYISDLSNFAAASRNTPGYEQINLINVQPQRAVNFSYAMGYHRASGNNGFKRLTLDNDLLILNGVFSIRENYTLESITGGRLDFSALTSEHAFIRDSTALTTFSVIQGSIGQSIEMSGSALSDATLVSIANGLDGTATGKTLTLDSGKKAHCAEILGSVADGVFTIDAQGSTTLTDFITTTKGWTLA